MVESIKELKKICRKQTHLYSFKEGVEDAKPVPKFFYHRFIDSISIYFVKALLYTPVTANQVTIFSVLVGMLAGFFFSSLKLSYWLIGFLILQFYFILDGVDGDIARYRKTANPIGKYYDIIAPTLVIPATFIGITYAAFKQVNDPKIFLLGFIIVVFFLVSALSNATKGFLIHEFAATKKNPEILSIIKNQKFTFPANGRIPLKYTLKKLCSFQGLAFLLPLIALLDFYFQPLVITIFNTNFFLTWRISFLIIMSIIVIAMFLLRFYKTI